MRSALCFKKKKGNVMITYLSYWGFACSAFWTAANVTWVDAPAKGDFCTIS